MGTPAFALPILGELVREHQVVAVYTRPDRPAGRGRELSPSPVKRVALEYGLTVIQHENLRSEGEVERLRALSPEAVVVAAYGLILPPAFLQVPPLGCLNLHPSLLPRHRGPAPIPYAILCGDKVTGVSLMLLDQGMDSGPLLAQSPLPISPCDTAQSLGGKLARLAARLLARDLPRWAKGEIHPQAQDPSAVTYTRVLKKGEGELSFRLPALELWLRVRAFHPFPGAFTFLEEKRLKVLAAEPEAGEAEPGRVVALPGGAGVGCGQGVLRLLRVQLEGRNPLPIEEFLRGRRDFVGARLG